MPPIPVRRPAANRVNLVMFNPNKFGGTVTYTAHLYHALADIGCSVMIYRLGARPGSIRNFGYGCQYRTMDVESMKRLAGYTLVTACIGKEFEEPTLELLKAGAWVTVHDPNDLGNFQDTTWTGHRRIVIIRSHNTRICPNATFIRHPFKRTFKGNTYSTGRPRHAVTLSRLGAIKRTKWILDANRLLPQDRQVWLRGYDDRFFTYNQFVRKGNYPEFKQDAELPDDQKKTFAKEMGEAQRIAVQARFLVDLTHIKGDGGGTQYTFLEALDSGCCLILNRAWIEADEVPDEHRVFTSGHNCFAVASTDELVEVLTTEQHPAHVKGIVENGVGLLPLHDHRKIGAEYLEFFGRTAGKE